MDSAVVDFVERIGLASEAEGLPRIAGRIFGYMIVREEPVTVDDLTGALMVSRGSVSTNTRLLESMGVIERWTEPGKRQRYYRLCQDPFGHFLERSLERMRNLAHIVSDSRARIDGSAEGAEGPGARLAQMEKFYEFAIRHTESTLARWREKHVED